MTDNPNNLVAIGSGTPYFYADIALHVLENHDEAVLKAKGNHISKLFTALNAVKKYHPNPSSLSFSFEFWEDKATGYNPETFPGIVDLVQVKVSQSRSRPRRLPRSA